MRILSGVFATKKIPQRQEGLMKISADSSLLSSKDKSIAFSGRVLIEIEGVKVRGPSARFVYDESGQRLKAVEMDGGVRVNDWNKLATSESVKIDLDRNQYLFKGSPSLVQEDDELFGDEILFLNGGKQVKIKNARVKVSRERMEEIN
jgi:lipopolysaccharide assembly outer membrane protein LptD (OstA)